MSVKQKAFHGSQKIKDDLLAELESSLNADAKICEKCGKPIDYRVTNCGATLHLYRTVLGLPKWLTILEDFIYWQSDEYERFPIDLIRSIPVGADLTLAEYRIRKRILTEVFELDRSKYPEVAKFLNLTLSLLDRAINGKVVTKKEWHSTARLTKKAVDSTPYKETGTVCAAARFATCIGVSCLSRFPETAYCAFLAADAVTIELASKSIGQSDKPPLAKSALDKIRNIALEEVSK